MALNVVCQNGHSFIAADIYIDWPVGAPHCPECFSTWKRKQNKPKDKKKPRTNRKKKK